MVRSVTVNIAGQKLSIRTDASDEELSELTSLVNGRVREIRAGSASASPAKVYLLTALAVAEELRLAKVELARIRESVTTHAQGALRFLEEDAPPG